MDAIATDVPSDWPWRIRNSNRVVTSGVASDCPWIAAFAVTAYASAEYSPHLQSLHQRTQLHHLWSSTTHLVHKLAGVGEGTCNFCKLFNLTFLHCYRILMF
ncbi:hypothetical protein EMCRGX_G018595 [Ephydatia muelleri]